MLFIINGIWEILKQEVKLFNCVGLISYQKGGLEMTKFDLSNKVALVTGGGKGIGKAIALGLAEAGAKVVICGRTKERLDETVEEIKGMGGEALAVQADITDNAQVERLVEISAEKFGSIDILVNNAARSFMRSLLEMREDGWDKVFNTNCKGTFLVSRAVAKIMIEKGGGRIINITSTAAERGGRLIGVYHASKAAVKMLTQCMAVEWAEYNINVNAVGPGLTRTDFSKPIWSNEKLSKSRIQNIPKGRIAEPDEIVGAVLFLASDAANFITGQTIYVDGGYLST